MSGPNRSVSMEKRVQAFWNGTKLTQGNDFAVSGGLCWRLPDSDAPMLSVAAGSSGFSSVLAQPTGSNRTIALTMKESPEPGIYTFTPTTEDDEIEIRLDFPEEPFPEQQMHTLDLSSELSGVQVGDSIVVGLREDGVEQPGLKEIQGIVIAVVDSSGAVPDPSQSFIDYSESPIVSVLVDFSDQADVERDKLKVFPSIAHRLNPPSGPQGTVDVFGTSEPFSIQWEGKSDTAALSVEYVRVDPQAGESWTVRNKSLPEIEFSPLIDLSLTKRIEQFESAIGQTSNLSLSEDVLRKLASAVDGEVPNMDVTVQYESSKSDQLVTKTGTLESVVSVYYADRNRACHQIRFVNGSLHYLLLDAHSDTTSPVGVYSKSYARHWDTDLGDVRSIDIS